MIKTKRCTEPQHSAELPAPQQCGHTISSASINEAQEREDLAKRDGNTIGKRKSGEELVLISPAVLESLLQSQALSSEVVIWAQTHITQTYPRAGQDAPAESVSLNTKKSFQINTLLRELHKSSQTQGRDTSLCPEGLLQVTTCAHMPLDLHPYPLNTEQLTAHSHEGWEQLASSVSLTPPPSNLLLLKAHCCTAKPVLLLGFINLAVSTLLIIRMLK